MGTVAETTASLRVVGPELIPADITARLGRLPDLAYGKGQPRPLPNGRSGGPAPTGMWSISAGTGHSGNLDAQIAELLAVVTGDLSVWQQLTSDYHVDVFCGLFIAGGNQGLTLQPSTLAALGARGVALGLDLYAAD